MDDVFFDTPGNPRPDGLSGDFLNAGKLRLRYGRCPAATPEPKGTVVILPGRNEAIEKYFETMRDLAGRGLGSAILDWRGQGASDRIHRDALRGHVRRFDDYVEDLDQFLTQVVLPDCRGPCFLLGHSTGSLIALLASPVLAGRIARMMLVAPFLSITGMPVSMVGARRIAAVFRMLGLGGIYAFGARPDPKPAFATNKLTTDPVRFRRNRDIVETWPQLGLSGPTMSWIHAACIASATVQDPAFGRHLTIPTLIVAAGADEVVSTRAIESFSRTAKSVSLLTIDGARHEILQEADLYREQLMAALDAFIPGEGAGGQPGAASQPDGPETAGRTLA